MADSYQKYLEQRHQKFNTADSLIENVVKEATNSSIDTKQKLLKGEENEVYEIVTSSRKKIIVRIHRGDHNAFLAEKWAIDRCEKLGLPVPKILLIKSADVEDKKMYFCVQEFLPGDTLERGNIDYSKLDKKLLRKLINQAGEMLSKIHTISTQKVGWLDEKGEGIYESELIRFNRLKSKEEEIEKIFKALNINPTIFNKILKILKDNLFLFEKYSYVLNHGDYSPKHIMVKEDKITGILDFGGVCSEPGGVYDFFWWDYWQENYLPVEWIKEGYANKKLFTGDFEALLRIYRINRGLELLHWYYLEKYMPAVKKAEKKLLKDLEYFP